jgi:hypothetical protein
MVGKIEKAWKEDYIAFSLPSKKALLCSKGLKNSSLKGRLLNQF